MPIGHRNVSLETWHDDGSEAFAELFARVESGPVREGG